MRADKENLICFLIIISTICQAKLNNELNLSFLSNNEQEIINIKVNFILSKIFKRDVKYKIISEDKIEDKGNYWPCINNEQETRNKELEC